MIKLGLLGLFLILNIIAIFVFSILATIHFKDIYLKIYFGYMAAFIGIIFILPPFIAPFIDM